MATKILLIDHNDSFTFNLVQLFEEINGVNVTVINTKEIPGVNVPIYDGIVLSPGPGLPVEYPDVQKLIHAHHTRKPILGICLGLQEIVTCFGGKLFNLPRVQHGLQRTIRVVNIDPLYSGLTNPVNVGLYHSWAADKDFLPNCLTITATTNDEMIMSLKHRMYPISAVQFHPESYMTPKGKLMLENWVSSL